MGGTKQVAVSEADFQLDPRLSPVCLHYVLCDSGSQTLHVSAGASVGAAAEASGLLLFIARFLKCACDPPCPREGGCASSGTEMGMGF